MSLVKTQAGFLGGRRGVIATTTRPRHLHFWGPIYPTSIFYILRGWKIAQRQWKSQTPHRIWESRLVARNLVFHRKDTRLSLLWFFFLNSFCIKIFCFFCLRSLRNFPEMFPFILGASWTGCRQPLLLQFRSQDWPPWAGWRRPEVSSPIPQSFPVLSPLPHLISPLLFL